jgi:hypothetical protein
MSSFNPYPPPPATATARDAELQGADGADLFVGMQPTMQVRGAGVACILAGVAFLFVAVQFALFAMSRHPIVFVIELVVALIGAGYFVVARAIMGARGWASTLGIVLSVLGGLVVVAVVLVSGAFSAVIAGVAALVTLVLLAVSTADVRRMARARAAMARLESGQNP